MDDVRPAIERRHGEVRRPRHDAEVGPEAPGRQAKPRERRAEHVLANDQPAVSRHHDPVGGQRAVRHVDALVLQVSERGRQLPDQRNDRADAARPHERLRKPASGGVGRDQRQAVAESQFRDRADVGEERVSEMTELLDAVAQRPLESRRRHELGPEPQQLP